MTAGEDFKVGDVVCIDGDKVMPMYTEDEEMFGVVAANAKKGGKVLVAAKSALGSKANTTEKVK